MKKRGQSGEAIRYLIIAVFIIAITTLGYNAAVKVKDRTCNAELVKFEIDLKNMDREVKFGSVEEFTKQTPCSADEIIFVALNKSLDPRVLDHVPLIRDSAQSGTQENVFVVKDKKLFKSFYAGNIDIDYPNYLCLLPRSEEINFFLEGKGKEVSMFSGCFQPECTYVPVEHGDTPPSPDDAQAIGILNEAVDFGRDEPCINCPNSVVSEYSDFLQTRENIEVFRKYEYCKENGKTNVEIIIRPNEGVELQDFRYYESIPKSCIDDLTTVLAPLPGVSIKYDPLIIWKFDTIRNEERFEYILDTILSDECREAIRGMGISDLLVGGIPAAVPPNINQVVGTLTNLNLSLGSINLDNSNPIEALDLKSFTTYNGDKKYLEYSFAGTASNTVENYVIKCSLQGRNNFQLQCERKEDFGFSMALDVEVTNRDITDSGLLIVISAGPLCGNDFVDAGEECDDGPLNSDTNPDACRSDCTLPMCGDGVVDPGIGDQCDNGPMNSDTAPDACRTSCTLPVCGDGIVDPGVGDKCDDGNNMDGDGCSSACKFEACAPQGGSICSAEQFCPGSQITASDSTRCCNAACEIATFCADCGSGMFNNVCDRSECNTISQGCFFDDQTFPLPNQCNACSGATCDSYSGDQTTCGSDPCGVGNCAWNAVAGKCEVSYTSFRWKCGIRWGSTSCPPGWPILDVYLGPDWQCITYSQCGQLACPPGTEFAPVSGDEVCTLTCDNTDISCGAYPSCENCNALDTFAGGNYCSGNTVVRDYNDYSCVSSSCSVSTAPQLVQDCAVSGQVCQSGSCVAATCSDGTPQNSCSATQPMYCDASLNLVNQCGTCGCLAGKICQGDGSCSNAVASLSADYSPKPPPKNVPPSPPAMPAGADWWYYDMTLAETSGLTGVSIDSRQRCYNSALSGNFCDPLKTDITVWFGTNTIPSGGTINSINSQYLWTDPSDTITLTETFYGTDDNGNSVQSSYSFTVT
jgi:cysteine-rich repeat protein